MNGESPQSQLTRRRMLKIVTAGTASLGVGSFLAACAAPATTSSPAPAATRTPGATAAATPTTRAVEKVSLMTAFRSSTSDAPWFLARDRGYFEAEGLDVEIIEGTGSATTARVVGAGSATFGVAGGGVVIQSAGAGIPIRAVLGVNQSSPEAAIVRRDSGMRTPKDLEGKDLAASHGSSTASLFPGFMSQNGADPDKVTMRFVAPQALNNLLIQGQVDGILTFMTNVIPIGAAGADSVAILYSEFGFNIPGNTIIANALTIRDRPELVRSFVAAAAKGLGDSIKEPDAAVDALIKASPQFGERRALVAQELALLQTTVRSPRTKDTPLGWMHVEDWREAIDILKQHGGLKEAPKVEEAMVNFIPG